MYTRLSMAVVTSNLLARAIAREPRAVRELIAILTPVLQVRIARVLVRRGAARHRDVRQEVLDLIQQVFVVLLDNDGRLLRSWDPARGMSFENFVGLIAEQQAVASFRSRSESLWRDYLVEPGDLDTSIDSSRTPERIAASKEALDLILRTVRAELSEPGSLLFQLLFVEARPLEDVCCIMGMSESSVYAWRSRLGRRIEEIANEILSDAPQSRDLLRGAT